MGDFWGFASVCKCNLQNGNRRQRKPTFLIWRANVPVYSLTKEQPVPLSKVPQLFPALGRKGNLSFSTVYRWVTKGLKVPSGKRVRLEASRLGGGWVTTMEAIDRFVDRLTSAHETSDQGVCPPELISRRERRAERAGEQLTAKGI